MKSFTRFLLALALFAGLCAPSFAGNWGTGNTANPTWAVPEVLGDGNDSRVAETFTAAQGGDPPYMATEPAAIEAGSNYTRSDFINPVGARGEVGSEAKARFKCAFGTQNNADPVLMPGMKNGPHGHTAFNPSFSELATYTRNRNFPYSVCDGGPLNATQYWEPTFYYEIKPGVYVKEKPNIATFYYEAHHNALAKTVRIPRGLQFILGVNPRDRMNTAFLATIPSGQGWDAGPIDGSAARGTDRLNGWAGYKIQKVYPANSLFCGSAPNGGCAVYVDPDEGNTADMGPQGPRQLLNGDGTDPWGGRAEPWNGTGYQYKLLRLHVVNSQGCWNGKDPTSANGRDHVSYELRKSDNSYGDVCPQGSWKQPIFVAIVEHTDYGYAHRQKLSLASDYTDPATGKLRPTLQHPRGSTMHADWQGGWEQQTLDTWLPRCLGVWINGVNPNTSAGCGGGLIDDNMTLKGGETDIPSNPWTGNPVVNIVDWGTLPAKQRYGAATNGAPISGTSAHPSH